MSRCTPWMFKERITLRRTLAATTLLLALIALGHPACLTQTEDTAQRAAAAMPLFPLPADGIVLVVIDDEPLAQHGAWPWSPRSLETLLRNISRRQPAQIIVSSTLAETLHSTTVLPTKRPASTIGYAVSLRTDSASDDNGADLSKAERHAAETIAFPSAPDDDTTLPSLAGIDLSANTARRQEGRAFGFEHSFPDSDGIVRTQPLAVRLEHLAFPHVSLAAAAQEKGFTPIITMAANGRPSGIAIGDERIPTPSDSRLKIHLRGEAGTFPRIPVSAFFDRTEEATTIEGQVVLVGIDAASVEAPLHTVLGTMPRIEWTANVLDTIVAQRWIRTPGRWGNALLILLLGIGFVFGMTRLDSVRQVTTALGIIALLWLIGLPLLAYASTALPIVALSFSTAIFLGVLFAWRCCLIDLPRRLLQKRLRGHFSPAAIDAVIAQPRLLNASEEHRNAVALSLDAKGFGGIAARLSAQELSAFLREYRALITEVLLGEEGFVDSWAGDECRALFGAPIAIANPSIRATRAALRIRQEIAARRDRWQKRFGINHLHVGIGIAAGAVVCSATSEGRIGEFLIGGNAVEAALVLRALNRPYRTTILVEETIADDADARFSFRPLLPLRPAGHDKTIVPAEFIGEKAIILPQMQDFLQARTAFLDKRYDEAAALFEGIVRKHPHDGPSAFFAERAKERSRNQPGER